MPQSLRKGEGARNWVFAQSCGGRSHSLTFFGQKFANILNKIEKLSREFENDSAVN